MHIAGRLVRHLAASTLHYSGVLSAYRHIVLRNRAIVLMYHRVLPDGRDATHLEPGMYVRRKTLSFHLRTLSRAYTLVTMDQLGTWLSGRMTCGRPPCAITFDDGWRDNYDVAFPLLREHGVPATVFLVTDAVGTPEMLDWPQIAEMERSGVAFGSHTASHAELGRCDDDTIRRELQRSRATLVSRLEHPSGWFCYPKGSQSSAARAIVRESFVGAVTTEFGAVGRGDDPFTLHRIGVHDDMCWTAALFAWRRALLP